MNSLLTMVQRTWELCSWILRAATEVSGLVAPFSSRAYHPVAEIGGLWQESNHVLAHLDKPISVVACLLRHRRSFGTGVFATAGGPDFRLAVH
jgi:hypothetical protein